ncbi:MAG: tetratricopeptide repeat protein [Sandaracinaceae bacterium]|nr:tetratricopeptide repeat protein [Sandaracinaceae bacterium]
MIEEGRRRELHLAAARAAIAAGRDSVEVGRHWAAAGETRRAAAAYLRATLEHAVRGDSPGVLRCAARALELGVDVEDAFTLQFVRAEAAWFAGDPALQRATLDEAWDAAQSDRDRALVACERGEWLRRNRRPEEALEELRRAVELAGASGDEDTRARALGRLASALAALGRTDEAQQALRSIDSAALGVTTRAIVEDVRGWVAGHVGDLALVRVAYASAAALYAEAGDLRRAAGAESNLADASNRLGRYAEAERALRRALELARKVGNRLTEGYALMNLGFALCESGRHDEAARTLAEAVRIARVTRDARVEIGSRLYGARASLWAGHAVAAADLERLAEEASGDVMLQANAWALAARAWLACGDARRASESAARALALLEERGAIEEGEGDVFWAAVLAFEAVEQSARAAGVRARGRQRVLDLAARITDGDARRSFLEDVAAHRFLTA